MEEGRLKVLRLPPAVPKPPAPKFGRLQLTSLGQPPTSIHFPTLLVWARSQLFHAVSSVQDQAGSWFGCAGALSVMC